MNSNTTVRSAQASDFDALMALYRQLHPHDPVLENGEDRKVFDEILDSSLLHLLVSQKAEVEGAIVASCYLNIIPNITRAASPYAIIENVITDEQHRSRGLGQQIITAALDLAWSTGCYKVMLQTGSRRPSTHAFYRACGFSAHDKTGYVARPA